MNRDAYIKLQMGDDAQLQKLFNDFWAARKALADYLYQNDEIIAIPEKRTASGN